MTRRKLQLFGVVRVESDDGTVPRFRSQRTMALLGYLVAERRAVARDALAALFWPDETQARGRSNLRRELHNLSHILPGCWEMDRQSVRFVGSSETSVDLLNFLAFEQAGQWAEAAALVRGDFLEGLYPDDNLEFEAWLLGERERWRQQAEDVLVRLVDLYIRQADYTAALKSARKLLQLTPWNEAIHRQVMLLLVRTGQRGAAMKQYTLCQTTLQAELGVAVSAETTALYERIKRNATFVQHNLPAPTTPFIGREEELSLLARWLGDLQVRLITITGLGGIGKTRLALAAARQLLDPSGPELGYPARFPDGLFFISLAPLQSSSQIVAAIAQALAFRFSAQGDPEQQLQTYLSDKQLLLILDNFEHLLDGVSTVAGLLQAAPQVSIMVTSRERLNLYQAHVLSIKGLTYPETVPSNLDSYTAVQLFLQTAQRTKHDFSLVEADSNDLVRICQLMEGMPLGIELAAIWSHTLSLTEIVVRLEQGLDLLQTEAVDLPERHRSMRAAFDMTWRYLSRSERDLFAKLSVFRGGFTPDAAKRIAQATLPALTSLVSKSLLRYSQEGQRYDMHELIRQYSAEKLSQNAAVETEVRTAHSRYYCDFLQKQNKSIFGRNLAEAIKVIESDLDNVRLAWHMAAAQGQFESLRNALDVLMEFYGLSGRVSEGYEAIDSATQQVRVRLANFPLKTPTDRRFWADLLLLCGRQSFLVAKFEQAIECYQECLDILRDPALAELDTRSQQANALRWLGQLIAQTDQARAKELYEQSLALFREVGDQAMVAGLSNLLGDTLRNLGDVKGGYRLLSESLAIAKATDDQLVQSFTLELLGLFQLQIGHLAEAEESHRQCLALCKKLDFESMVNSILSGLGVTLIWNGKFAEGCEYLIERTKKQFDKGYEPLAFTHNGLSMGYLHQGQYDQAKNHSDLSLSAARKSNVPRYIAASLWTKGRLALTQDDPTTTEQILNESLSIIEGIVLVGYHEGPLVGLALNAFRRGDLRAMGGYLLRSLQIAVGAENFLSLLDIFPAVALYLLGQGETYFALEVYALASRYAYVANSRWFEDVAGCHIEAAKADLTADMVAKAETRGKDRDVWATASELLAMLENERASRAARRPTRPAQSATRRDAQAS
jgi:predicted ATPase/DNA-binding SARP family transcriptional activator